MAYTRAAVERRRCLGTKKDGSPCRAWAVWDDPRQLCVQHAGRGHRGPQRNVYKPNRPGRYVPCRCEAYSFPHRPSAGLCRWPDPPVYRLTTPAGTKNPDSWVWPVGEVVRVERDEPEDFDPPTPRLYPRELTREEEVALVMERLGLPPGGYAQGAR